MKKRIYIAGPMTGMPGYNYPIFRGVAKLLREDGWDVISPVEMGDQIGSPEFLERHPAELAWLMRQEIEAIQTRADAIYLLPGWERSKGSREELFNALAKDLEIILHAEYVSHGADYSADKKGTHT